MEKPKIPVNEQERLASLRALRILDTEPEERFDRYTRLACRLFDVPTALLSFVDEERQWFKSRQGTETQQTPRDISFCGHAILEDRVFVVPDAANDVRFFDNPLVTEDPKIRFYAGFPVAAPDGSRVASFCLVDRRPRQLSDTELRLFGDLGRLVQTELARKAPDLEERLLGVTNREDFKVLMDFLLRFSGEMRVPIGMIVARVRNLLAVNKDFGPAAGDRILIDAARIVGASVRGSDVVGRIGPDEFYVFLPKCDAQEAQQVADRVRSRLADFNVGKEIPLDLRVYNGSADCAEKVPPSVEVLLGRAAGLMQATP